MRKRNIRSVGTAALGVSVLAAVSLFGAACGDGEPSPAEVTATGSETVEPATATPTTGVFGLIGPEAVWAPEGQVLSRVHQDCPQRQFSCVQAVMQEEGASPEAIAFFRATQWFMRDFQERGTVDLAILFVPWRANSNDDYAMVNGSPGIVYAEDGIQMQAAQGPLFAALNDAYENLVIWSPDNAFEAQEGSAEGGQRLIFQYTLNDSCHACLTGYWARVAFDFLPDGTYLGAELLGPCTGDAIDATPLPVSLESCPAQE